MRMLTGFTVCALALTAGVALAADMPSAIPSTTEYIIETRPMILGTVASVNDHELVVNSDQGSPIAMRMDTRTMLPSDLAVGNMVRTEFRVMENGDYYAQRVVPLRTEEEREMAYRHMGTSEPMAVNSSGEVEETSHTTTEHWDNVTSDSQPVTTTTGMDAEETNGTQNGVTTTENEKTEENAENRLTSTNDNNDQLPQTAGELPLFALLGVVALAGAAALGYRRRNA